MQKQPILRIAGTRRWAVRLALLTGVALAIPLTAMADDDEDSQAITDETNSALMQAGQDANAALG